MSREGEVAGLFESAQTHQILPNTALLFSSCSRLHVGQKRLVFNKIAFIGALAQLGERLPCTQEVSGSIPLGSTTLHAVYDAQQEMCLPCAHPTVEC